MGGSRTQEVIMSATAEVESEKVEFLYLWSCKESDLKGKDFNESVRSPCFSTVHNGLGFDWKLIVFPNGNQNSGKEYRDHLGFYLTKINLPHTQITIDKMNMFVLLDGNRENIRSSEEFLNDFEKFTRIGYSEFIGKDSVSSFVRKGKITFGIVMSMKETEFDWRKKLEEVEKEEAEDKTVWNSFDDIESLALEPEAKRSRNTKKPQNDIYNVLDFQIFTNDDHVIWCHKFVLVKKNMVFASMISTLMKEAEECQMSVNYDSQTMKEVLHFVYRGKISERFEKLDLLDILDAAKQYELDPIVLLCHRKLCEQLDVGKAAEFLELGDRYGLTYLKNLAINMISENMAGVRKTQKGKAMSEELWE